MVASMFRQHVVLGCVVAAALTVMARAQQPSAQPALPDIQKLGPQVGSRVPDFTLSDQRGPGTFNLNAQGVVTSRFFEQAYQERSTVGSILARLGDNVDVPATKISSPQIDITSYVTDATVAAGTHFSVVVDARPSRGVHVYAPGASGYKAVALSLDPHAGIVLRDARYPQSEDYFFKPLNEHVPVFAKPFRIVQDVMIDASPQAQAALRQTTNVTITGALTYQACNDTLCFAPQSVPLTWTVTLRRLDTDRAVR